MSERELQTEPLYDFAVIGAGVVGAAIARLLSHYSLKTALIESKPDIGMGTSKANTAILHTGFDAPPESLESRLLRRSYPLMKSLSRKIGIPLEEVGALLIAWTEEELLQFPSILEKAAKNGVLDLKSISREELYRREPHLGPGALAAIEVPGEGIICPYTPVLAFAYEAVRNGIDLRLNSPVRSIERQGTETLLRFDSGSLRTRWTINAAGLHSDTVDGYFGGSDFKITPRRGQLIVYDKLSRNNLRHILLPIPTKTTKGVLVSPTVFGNILLGPTAENLEDRADTATTQEGLAALLDKGGKIFPSLSSEEITATYSGLRAASQFQDYQIRIEPGRGYVCAGGIRSTGLSASLGIAEYVKELLESAGVSFHPRNPNEITDGVPMPPLGQNSLRPSESQEQIARNPDYGRIVCHCEQVSRGEIHDALSAPVPARSLDGLRRRTRCLQGRCQGFYCLAEVMGMLERSQEVRS